MTQCFRATQDKSGVASVGHGDTNGASNYTGSTSDMQDVNSPLQDPSRTSGRAKAAVQPLSVGRRKHL